MQLRLFQVGIILIALIFGWFWVRNFKESKIRIFELLTGLFVAVIFVLITLFPDAISGYLGRLIGIKSNINVMVFGSILLLLWLNFRMWMLIRHQDRRISELNSKIAIKEYKESKED